MIRHRARARLCLAAAVSVCTLALARVGAQSISPAPALADARFANERALLEQSSAARAASDYATAREKGAEVVSVLLATPEAEQDEAWTFVLEVAGKWNFDTGEIHVARDAYARLKEVRTRSLPPDHRDLLMARLMLGGCAYQAGDYESARTELRAVLEIREATLPDDASDVQVSRVNLAAVLSMMGDHEGARTLQEKAVEVYERTLPAEHPYRLAAQHGLAVALMELGDYTQARRLLESVFATQSRLLSDDDPQLQLTRTNLGTALLNTGENARAREMLAHALDARVRALPDDHVDVQIARINLGTALTELGELTEARELRERALEVLVRTYGADHPLVDKTQKALAETLIELGDLQGARALLEGVVRSRQRRFSEDHPDVVFARERLAITLLAMGDVAGARPLSDAVLESRLRTLPEDDPLTMIARSNVAEIAWKAGDMAGARESFAAVLEVLSRSWPDDYPQVLTAKSNLAAALAELGDVEAARDMFEEVFKTRSRTLPNEHHDLQSARISLAAVIARGAHDSTVAEAARDRCRELIRALADAQIRAARAAVFESSAREAEERCARMTDELEATWAFVAGYGGLGPLRELEPDAFVLSETTRGAAVLSAGLARAGASSPEYRARRDALRAASAELAALTRSGASTEALERARASRESIERDLATLARDLSGGAAGVVDLGIDRLADRLEPSTAAVAFRCVRNPPESRGSPPHSLIAFVVRSRRSDPPPPAELTLVDLGPIEPIESAVRAWRAQVGVAAASRGVAVAVSSAGSDARERGTVLRKLVFDPLRTALGNATQIVCALDDVLHLVPVDALPLDEVELVGDRWQIELRSTLTELFENARRSGADGAFVGFGDVAYQPAESAESAPVDIRSASEAGALRGGVWEHGFAPLAATGAEVRGIAGCYSTQFGEQAEMDVLDKATATTERLVELAPRARWLHIATHGWFAPDTISSWTDRTDLDERSPGVARSASSKHGMSPMLLCGLAFAGANAPVDSLGQMPGLLTADELSTLDLSSCELAVLSACDTNVGERRAGQGVASLQRALQMAGARSAITSLWKVPDEATKELMVDFYRRLWVEKKPKWQALWEAKKALREMKDEHGAPKYTTRDWAAWVLTGAPD